MPLVVLLLLLLALAPAAAAQIPQEPDPDPAPAFTGEPWAAKPVFVPAAPRHPFMAPNQRSNLHADAHQTDVNAWSGPLGRETETLSRYEAPGGVCGSVTFNSKGQIVTTCIQLRAVRMKLLDPRTLEELASIELPPRSPSLNPFQDFAGGGYFYLDNDRAVIPTTDRHILVIALEDGEFVIERDYDLNGPVPADAKIISALPDWDGLLWFATTAGIIGTVDPDGGAIETMDLGEVVQNSFAVGEDGGVYIVSELALYRFDAGPGGVPQVSWREVYENTGELKPGQVSAGSGTTPTLHGDDWVSITDNADPVNVVVYRRGLDVTGEREVCRQAVFEAGRSSTDNSLIAAGNSIIVENNHGYTGPTATTGSAHTEPGIERVDIDAHGRRCRRVWHSDEASPSVVPKLSLANGLVYVYTQDESDGDDPWYLTALDFRTGETVWKSLTGQGLGFNNNYAPVTIGPDGTAYVGVLGGLTLVRDREAPPQGVETRPRIKLNARRRGKRVRFRATAPSGGVVAPVRGARIKAGKRRTRTNAKGRASLKIAKGRAIAKKRGYRKGSRKVPR